MSWYVAVPTTSTSVHGVCLPTVGEGAVGDKRDKSPRVRRMKAIVLEDSPKAARFVAQILHEEGYAVDLCATGFDALRLAELGGHDLFILDWMVPDIDGLSVCRELRRRGFSTPIMMLTARSRVSERVLGLEAGADDYVVKPFEVAELVARIHALARRATGHGRIRCGSLEIDRAKRQAFVGGKRLTLTAREFALLLRLATSAGKVVKRSDLQTSVWESISTPVPTLSRCT